MSHELVLSMKNITKEFPGVKALDCVNFDLKKGEIHAICGENGAGKSTLLKILNGMYQSFEGEIQVLGKPVHFQSTRDARSKGLSIIPQEIQLAGDLSVAENIFLGHYPKNRIGLVDWAKLRADSKLLQARLGPQAEHIEVSEPVKNLSIGRRQIVEILKAISTQVEILALDEPTSSLSDEETAQLFKLLRKLADDGTSIIYVTHRLKEIKALCDRVTILKDGRYVATHEMGTITEDEIAALMVGRNIQLFNRSAEPKTNSNALALEVKGFNKNGVFSDISFTVKKGEIVGFFGIVGAGRTEVVRALFGVDRKDSGTVSLFGKPVKIDSPRDAVKHRIGLVPEERHRQGLVLIAPVRWNLTLAFIKTLARFNIISKRMEAQASEKQIASLRIKAPSDSTIVNTLSGGNQQKIVIGRWLGADSDVLIFDEPTRGIDVGAKLEIYKILRTLAGQGKAIIMVSSELPEIMGMSDRIYVFKDGKISRELENTETVTDVELLNYAISGYKGVVS